MSSPAEAVPARSLLLPDEPAPEPISLQEVRDVVRISSSVRDSKKVYIDPGELFQLSLHYDGALFVVKDNVYSEEELRRLYPFDRMRVAPQGFFERQLLGLYPVDSSVVLRGGRVVMDPMRCEIVAAPADAPERMQRACDALRGERRPPEVWVRTEIYIARKAWKRFKQMVGFLSTFQIVAGQLEGGLGEALRIMAPAAAGDAAGDGKAGEAPRSADSNEEI